MKKQEDLLKAKENHRDESFRSFEYPMVSIAMCTYNGEKFIRSQLDTLLNQTYSNLEIIICDDGSTDNTLEIIRSFDDPRITIFSNEKNIGPESNFFKAISHCSGSYIALSDQDDIWMLEKIEILLQNMGDNCLIYADSAFTDHSGILTGSKISDLRRMYSGNDNRVFSLPFVPCLFGHALLFNSSLKEKILLGHPKIYHDGWIGFVATSNGSIKYLDKVLVNYRQHGNSVTQRSGKEKKQNNLTSYLNTWFIAIEQYTGEKNKLFFEKLLLLYNKHKLSNRYIQLFIFLFRNREIIFYTKPKLFSQINLIRKVFRN